MNSEPTQIEGTLLCRPASIAFCSLQLHMNNHALHHDNGRDLLAIGKPVIRDEMKSHAYPFTLYTTDELEAIDCR